jgi:hypothetical protein
MTFHSSNPLLGTLVVACLFASACGANPDDSGDASGGAGSLGAGGDLVAGASGSGKGVAGSGGGALSSAGSLGTSGGAAGSFGSGGSAAGGNAGFGGSRSAAGGAGLGGFGGIGGQGAGGHAHGGAGGAGGAGGGSGGTTTVTVTFTQLYTQFFHNSQFASNCVGYGCHVPANHGIDFSTQASGYASVKANLSRVVSDISEGYMPRGRTQWPAADVALLKAWQAEGAPNN